MNAARLIERLRARAAALAETKPDTALVMEAMAYLLARDATVNRLAEAFMEQSIERAIRGRKMAAKPARPVNGEGK